jgi:hypothetical protein
MVSDATARDNADVLVAVTVAGYPREKVTQVLQLTLFVSCLSRLYGQIVGYYAFGIQALPQRS